jgi:hypothetical protein
MKKTMLALVIPAALLLAACGSSSEPVAAGPTTPAPIATSAPNIFSAAAKPSPAEPVVKPVTETSSTPAVDEALATLGATPGMDEYLPALVAGGVATTADELVAIGMYTPSMCSLKAQMKMSDADAAKHVPDDLAGSGVTLDQAQAKALIAAANEYVCQ